MNPGILSFLLVLISLVLLIFGWTKVLARNIPNPVLWGFFTFWFIGDFVHFHLAHFHFDGNAVVLIGTCMAVLWRTPGILPRIHLISVGMLLSSIYFLCQEVLFTEPVLVLYRSSLDAAAVIALLVPFFVRQTSRQLLCVTIALLFGRWLQYRLLGAVDGFLLGGGYLSDEWWLAVILARLVSECRLLAIWGLGGLKRKLVRLWNSEDGNPEP